MIKSDNSIQPAKILETKAIGKPTKAGKEIIAFSMYSKGKAFLEAAEILKGKQESNSVYLHLLCQGFEILSKALLLFKDYDKYRPILGGGSKTKGPKADFIGHDLLKLFDRVKNDANLDFYNKEIRDELTELNKYYPLHKFRYGSSVDTFIDYNSLKSENLSILTSELTKAIDNILNVA